MMKKKAIVFVLLLCIAALFGCKSKTDILADDNKYSELCDKYFCDTYMQGNYRQAWKLNIEDGSIFTACPDPLCGHGSADSACPFCSVIPVKIVDGGRYLFYVGFSNRENAIYCFDTEENKTSKIYVYDKLPSSNPQFLYGEGRLYFDIPVIKTADGEYVETTERILMYYDISTKKIKEYGKRDESQRLLFEYNGKLYYRDDTGIYSTNGEFDTGEPLPLPNGGKLDAFGGYFECGPGYVAKSSAPADIYLFDEGKSVPIPAEASGCYLVGLSATGDTFYFTLGGAETTDGEDGHYTVKICILNKDGAYKIYAVQSDVSFYVCKGYGDRVVCSILGEYKDGVDLSYYSEENYTPNNLMWIDLQTGKTSLYNVYAENVLDKHLNDITVKTERIK